MLNLLHFFILLMHLRPAHYHGKNKLINYKKRWFISRNAPRV